MFVAERSPWRRPAAALALTVAAAHVPVTAQHLAEAPYIGWSFIGLEVAAVVLAALLITRDVPVVWHGAAIVPGLAILAYAVTRSVALPQIGDDVGKWTEPLGVVAVIAEALLIVVSLAHHGRLWRFSRGTTASIATGGLLLILGVIATSYAATINGAA